MMFLHRTVTRRLYRLQIPTPGSVSNKWQTAGYASRLWQGCTDGTRLGTNPVGCGVDCRLRGMIRVITVPTATGSSIVLPVHPARAMDFEHASSRNSPAYPFCRSALLIQCGTLPQSRIDCDLHLPGTLHASRLSFACESGIRGVTARFAPVPPD